MVSVGLELAVTQFSVANALPGFTRSEVASKVILILTLYAPVVVALQDQLIADQSLK